MNESLYRTFTVSYYLLCMIGGIFLNDVGVLFEFISSICISFILYIYPAAFYLKAESNYATHGYKQENGGRRYLAYLFILIGTC